MKTAAKKIQYIALFLVLALFIGIFPAQRAEAASTESYLFIGNSLTYYNNMPAMFQGIATAGGRNISVTAITYMGRTMYAHSYAIQAVIRTKGNVNKLTAAEKKYFCYHSTETFSADIYKNYAQAIWDYNNNKPKHYDKVVLQVTHRLGAGDIPADKAAKTFARIFEARNDAKTTYIISIPAPKLQTTVYKAAKEQANADKEINAAIKTVKNNTSLKTKYKSIVTAYTGRAFFNYLYYAGTKRTINREQTIGYMDYFYSILAAYKGYLNDLYYGDYIHPTPIGSYLMAATLYESIYGGVRSTCASYKGASPTPLKTVEGKNGAHFMNGYNNNAGFVDTTIVNYAAFIAEATMKYGMTLKSSDNGTAWRNDTTKPQYARIYETMDVQFINNSGHGDESTSQLYYYIDGVTQSLYGGMGRYGYDLEGWAAKKTSSTIDYMPSGEVTPDYIEYWFKKKGTAKAYLYAIWDPHSIMLRFDMNGGNGLQLQSLEIEYNDEDAELYLQSTEIPERDGYEFLGWSVNADTSTLDFPAGYCFTSDDAERLYQQYGESLRLYAIWMPIG